MKTAEEVLGNNIDGLKDALQDDDLFYFYKGVIIEFAKSLTEMHVEEALKSASEKAQAYQNCKDSDPIIVSKNSITSAYPLENIK